MSQKLDTSPAVIGIDIGKNSFHIIGQNRRGAIVLRQKWSRGQVEARLANLPPCLIGMEACTGAHHLSRKLQAHGHDARLMPAKYVRPYSKGQKNDFRDAEAIAEAVQRPTMKFVMKTHDQLDLQAPGEAKSVSAAPIYGTVRVCNHTTSKGTVTVTIGRESAVLAPGLCTEDIGGSVDLANDHSGPAVIFYRSKRETNCPGHGG